MPLALVLAVETVARTSVGSAIRWMVLPETANPLRFTYLWVQFGFLFLYAACNRLRWAAVLCFAVTMSVAVLHAGKLALLQQPLVPGDFALVGMTSGIWSVSYFPFTWMQVICFCLATAGWIAMCRRGLPDWRLGRNRRLLLLLSSGAGILIFSVNVALLAVRTVPLDHKLTTKWSHESNQNGQRQADPGIQNPDLSATFNYLSFGLVSGFLLNLDTPMSEEETRPPIYDEASVRRTWQDIPADDPDDHTRSMPPDPKDRPHVVVVLSESFWDPARLEGVSISPDPLTHFHALAATSNACAFSTFSPIFGGYTCNAEFELLTGVAMATLAQNAVPHRHAFQAHVPSLPAVFKQGGYQTAAIHPFLPEFWNRNMIYPRIGFDRFIHIRNIQHREVQGKYISDNAVADEIINCLDAATEPTFLFVITMQNHSPYGDRRYGDVELQTIRVEKPTVSVDAVRDYVHGLRDADAMLDKLTRHLASSERRTLLLFLGDHQPNLIPAEAAPGLFTQSLRQKAGAHTLSSIKGKYEGVALFWSSKGATPASPSTPVSLAALPAWILREADLPLPPFFRLSARVFQKYPVLCRNWGMTATGEVCALRLPFQDPLLQDYQRVSYDILFGRNYSRVIAPELEASRRALAIQPR